MSMYFDTDGQTLWNPSNGAGRLFLEMPQPSSGHTCSGGRRDVQVPGNPRAGTADIATALDTRAQEIDRWMAR
ncbi:DUF6086 family protein [Streptomyces tendae]|uniref:DUF6086 family protein n=1 Tax=Streptomyces tendae TaxID=1932 RepID=UPI0036B40D80